MSRTIKAPKSLDDYPFPLYATQGGGYARILGEVAIFVEPPEGMFAGQCVPERWSLVPANKKAREEEFEF